MAYFLGLTLGVSLFWFGLSGHLEFPILHMGIGSIIFVLWFCHRLKILDVEASPYMRMPRAIGYWFWLGGEVIKANMVVVRAALKATPDIEPAMTRVKTTCKSDLAKVTFANSITLTPGTVTIDMEGDELIVHGLYAKDVAPGSFDEMDQRTAKAIDGKR
ncbi:Na+/H+ antiporter subunit E [Hirschia maritima]|uniref:Na+/H+ antiporter subunit E n=1 Tax=Hirschia maritima TaxID=1121961 RepID=UPI0004771E99|nr:Na+/H+ antiporter subunit E [Hirschia maritima]